MQGAATLESLDPSAQATGSGAAKRDASPPHERTALDVVVSWGSSVLRTAHVSPPRSFHLDDEDESPLVVVRDGAVVLVVPPSASCALRDVTGATQLLRAGSIEPLASGSRARLVMGTRTVEVSLGPAPDTAPFFARRGRTIIGPFSAALFFHVAALALLVFAAPPRLADAIANDDLPRSTTFDPQVDGEGADAPPHARVAPPRAKNADTTLTLMEQIALVVARAAPPGAPPKTVDTAARAGRSVDSVDAFDVRGPEPERSNAFAERAASGHEFFDQGRDALPRLGGGARDDTAGGLRLHSFSLPERGVGQGRGYCDDASATTQHGASPCVGSGAGHHAARSPTMRLGVATIAGRLPASAIQRVLHANSGRFLGCYARALQSNPSLAGRVVASFTIDTSGAVAAATDGGSDLADASVIACAIGSVRALRFPTNETGDVHVTYPIVFSTVD